MNSVASIKDKLKNKSRETGRTLQELFTLYGLERTIYRLSVSPYKENFVLTKSCKKCLTFAAMHVQRAVKAQVGGGINEVDVVVLIPQQLLQFRQHHRAVRQAVQLFQHLVAVPILGIAVPDRHIDICVRLNNSLSDLCTPGFVSDCMISI